MKIGAKIAVLFLSGLLCLSGIIISHLSRSQNASGRVDSEGQPAAFGNDEYQFAAAKSQPQLTLQELETIVRGDPMAKLHYARIEFGSLRLEHGTAFAQVFFVSDDGRVLPFIYKLLPERDSWKIVNVQRIWFVPRSRLLRGVRV